MIELKNVSKYYNNNGNVSLGLRNVNLKLNRGDIVAIVGESGAGKSTLLNVICGVDTYEEGEIFFKGNETSYFNQNDMDSFRNKYVGFIYQQYNIIDSYTVLENVMLPLLLKGLEYPDAKKAALDIIDRVGLSHRVSNKGIHLSGGEKQRCVIARALASDCDILACDEPTGNLDSKTGDEIIQLIKEVAADKLVLIVTHNYEQVKDICNRTIRISDGEVVQDYSTLEEETEEAGEEMDLNHKGVAFKNLVRIAFQNIKNTPKKTVFGCIILFLVAFLILFLSMSCLSYNDTRQFTDNDYYKNT
ncbi:MAG: ABC transporter ATP-binding protein, partial [Anaeroplasmataceae bacterium]|nr:ABC transporter ATP-binding protein [Anaeroplasmataceae bacterium]